MQQRQLKRKNFQTVVVSSSQHKELLTPFLKMLEIEIDFDLQVMKKIKRRMKFVQRFWQNWIKFWKPKSPI